MIRIILKYGGIAFSAALTIKMFYDLFLPSSGPAFALLMCLSALAFFEGGGIAWSKLLETARGGQIAVAQLATWFCVICSIVSSASEIIMATNLWKPDFDIQFFALSTIIAAVTVCLIGIFAYDQLNPDRLQMHRKAARAARAESKVHTEEDKVEALAMVKVDERAEAMAERVANIHADAIVERVAAIMLTGKEPAPKQLEAPAETKPAKPEGAAANKDVLAQLLQALVQENKGGPVA